MPPLDTKEQAQPIELKNKRGYGQFVLWLFLGIIGGVAITLVAGLYLLGSTQGKSFLLNFYYSAVADHVVSTQMQSQEIPQVEVLIPKKLAGEEYYTAFNSLVNSFNLVATTTNQLSVELQAINARAATGNYAGLFDIVYKAKNLISQGETQIDQFHAALSKLDAASLSVKDSQTRTLNQELLNRGQLLDKTFSLEYKLINDLLTGTIPTDAQISAVVGETQTLEMQSSSFTQKAQEMIAYFASNK